MKRTKTPSTNDRKLAQLIEAAKIIKVIEETGVKRLDRAKAGLSEQRPLTASEWTALLDELESGLLGSAEAKRLLRQMNDLYKKHGENALSSPQDAQENSNEADSLVLTIVDTLASRYRRNLQTRWKIPQKPIRNILQHWSEYSYELDKDMDSPRRKNKRSLTLEIAKLLSFSQPFQEALQALRAKWNIQPDKGFIQYLAHDHPHYLHPETLIRLMTANRSSDLLFRDDLKRHIFERFPTLNETEDYGLIIAALCMKLDKETLLKDWDVVWRIASYHSDANLTVAPQIDDAAGLISVFLTIAYLIKEFAPEFIPVSSLDENAIPSVPAKNQQLKREIPSVIEAWIRFAFDQYQEFQRAGMEDIPQLIELIRGLPANYITSLAKEPDLFLRITPETYTSHFEQLWSKITLARISLWGQPHTDSSPRTLDEWTTFDRDVRLAQIFEEFEAKEEKIPYRKVVELYQQRYPEADRLADTVERSVEQVKKARQRWEQRMKALNGTIREK